MLIFFAQVRNGFEEVLLFLQQTRFFQLMGLDCVIGLDVEDLGALEVNGKFFLELSLPVQLRVSLIEFVKDLFVESLIEFVMVNLGLLLFNEGLLLL
jgi:hypothetical protein